MMWLVVIFSCSEFFDYFLRPAGLVDCGCDHGRNWIKIFVFIGTFSTAKAALSCLLSNLFCSAGQRWFFFQQREILPWNSYFLFLNLFKGHVVNISSLMMMMMSNLMGPECLQSLLVKCWEEKVVKQGIKTSASVQHHSSSWWAQTAQWWWWQLLWLRSIETFSKTLFLGSTSQHHLGVIDGLHNHLNSQTHNLMQDHHFKIISCIKSP